MMMFVPYVLDKTEIARDFDAENPPQVLLIDDDENILQSLGNILKSFGFEVTLENQYVNLQNLLHTMEFDCVVTDLKMENLSGFDVLRATREHQPATPVIILTGYATLFSAIEALQEGAFGYLVKPCNVKEMQMLMERGIRQKMLLQERDRFFRELEQKNEELTTALNELREERDLRETMVSMFTHDLYNPVTTVQGFLNIIREDIKDQVDPKTLEYVAIIKRNLKKIELLIDSFQTFFQIDNYSYHVQKTRINFVACVKEAVKNVQPFASERSISIEAHYAVDEIVISGDAFELERPFTNILHNAVKFSPKNAVVKLHLFTLAKTSVPTSHEIDLDSDQLACVTITDYGCGINAEDCQKIFRKLYRGANARETRGSGIGLFISKTIIDLHGGAIFLESEKNMGSTFTIYFPVSEQTPE